MESLTFTLKTLKGKTLREEVLFASTLEEIVKKAQALLREDSSESSYCVTVKASNKKIATVKFKTIPFSVRIATIDTRKNNEDLAITPFLFTPFARVKRIGAFMFGIGICWLYFAVLVSFDFNRPAGKGLEVELFSKLF